MMQQWQSVLPVDRYIVRLHGLLHDDDRKVLTQLYQPLMGAAAYSLYMTLWGEVERNRFWGKPSTHHSLMTMMRLQLKDIFGQRKKLEGLALLKTFVKKTQGDRLFLYELQAPLDPVAFFNHAVLGVYLFNCLGRQKFQTLKEQFSHPIADAKEYREVTASFDKVFHSLHSSELHPSQETKEAITLGEGWEWAGRVPSEDLHVSEVFDFDMMLTHLSTFIVPRESISEKVKEAIMILAYVYHIDPFEMSRLVEEAYSPLGEQVNIEVLQKEVEKWYAFEHHDQLPALSVRKQPQQYCTTRDQVPLNEEEKIVQGFETYSPFELFEQIASGAKPAYSDLKVVESIMLEQKLLPGVVNVLIDYVMTTNDMKFPRKYVEKIAGHWARKNVKTVKEAMALAREEHRKYQNWNQGKANAQAKQPVARKNGRLDKLPKWMTEEKQTQVSKDWDVKRSQLEQRFEKYKKTNG